MKRIIRKLGFLTLGIFIYLVNQNTAMATSYYVSQSMGSDTNNGLSDQTPWQSLSKVSHYTFAAGDSILLKAGDSFDGPLKITSAGTQASPITISSYGTGANPIIYGDHPSAVWSPVAGFPGVYSTNLGTGTSVEHVYDINGNKYNLLSQGTESLDTWLSSFVAYSWGNEDSITGIYYLRTPDGNPPPQMHLFEWSTVIAGANYITIENLDVRNGGFGILASSLGVICRNNSTQDTLGSGIFYENSSNGEIANNVITLTGNTSIYLSKMANTWVHNNTISHSGGNAQGWTMLGNIQLPTEEQCGIGLQQGMNNIVEHNSISYVYGSFIDYWLEVNSIVRFNYGFNSNGAAYPDGTGLQLYNNVFDTNGGAGIGGGHDYDPVNSPAPDSGPNLVYNNVVYSTMSYGLYSGLNPEVISRDNIFVVTTNTTGFVQISQGINDDYNLYYSTAGASRGWYWITSFTPIIETGYSTLSAFQAASGQDANSIYSNPLFVSAAPVQAADFAFQPTSPAIVQQGMDIGLTTNIAGYPGNVPTAILGFESIPTSLTVTLSGSGSGTVTSYPVSGNPSVINCGSTCSGTFNSGEPVILTASGNAHSTFSGWSGGGCSGTGTCVVTMNSSQTITANFVLSAQYSLTVTTAGNGYGEIFSSDGIINCGANLPPAPDVCSDMVNAATTVTLTATPASGSVFSGWSGGGCSGTGSCTVTMSAAQNVTANFAPSVVNGVCGTADQTYLFNVTSFGTNTLCKSGTASPASVAFPAPGTKVTWTCLGVNNGFNSTCSAQRNKTKLLKLL